jgi:hypothetical protein
MGKAMRSDAAAAEMVETLKLARDVVGRTMPWDKAPGGDMVFDKATDQLIDKLNTHHTATAQEQVQEMGSDWGGKLLDGVGQQLYGYYHEHHEDNRVPAEVRDLFDDHGRLKPDVDTNPIRTWLLDHPAEAGLDGNTVVGKAEDGYNNIVHKPYPAY